MRGLRLLGITAVLLLAVLTIAGTISRTSVTVPEWSVQLVDGDGSPVPFACVSQSWQQYSFEREGQSDERRADSAGRVVFPERRATASLLRRVVGPLSQLPNVHASYGTHAWIIAWAPERQGMATYDGGDSLTHRLILERDPTGFHERADGRCSPPDVDVVAPKQTS
jgi:hypothetical protein